MARIEFDGLQFDPSDGTLSAEGAGTQTLRPQVGRLLEVLLERSGEVLDRETLCKAIWGEDRVVDFEAGLSALVKELRQALRSVGAPETLLETVPRRGYRFHASIDSDANSPENESSRRPRTPFYLFASVTVLSVLAIVFWFTFDSSQPDDERPRMAVVPFELLGTAEPDTSNLDLVLADTLLAALWQSDLDDLVLLGRTSMGADLDGRARVEFVARELDASLVLEGSLIRGASNDGSGWRVEARLLRLPRGEVVWTSTVSGPPGEPISAGEVAAILAEDLSMHWSDVSVEL